MSTDLDALAADVALAAMAPLDRLRADPDFAPLVAECTVGGTLDEARLCEGLQARVDQLESHRAALSQYVETGTVPEGSPFRVLSAEQAAELAEWKALGTPEEIRAGMDEVAALKSKLALADRDDALRRGGFDPATLGRLLPADAVIDEAEDASKPGRTLRISVAGGEPTPLADWVASELSAFGYETFRLDAPARDVRASRGSPPRPDGRRHGMPPANDNGKTDLDRIRDDIRRRVGFGGF